MLYEVNGREMRLTTGADGGKVLVATDTTGPKTSCPACGSGAAPRLVRRHRNPIFHGAIVCPSCDHIYTGASR